MAPKHKRVVFLFCAVVLSLGLIGSYSYLYIRGVTAERQSTASTISPYQQYRLLMQNYQPVRDWSVKEIDLTARAVGVIELEKGRSQKILFSKNMQQSLPIASLSKLIGAMIVLDNYNLEQTVTISQKAISQAGNAGLLKKGEQLTVKNLLKLSLIESSNDAIYALSEIEGTDHFIRLMNEKAQNIGMIQSLFVNSTGLYENGQTNYSSGLDLIKMVEHLLTRPEYKLIINIISTEDDSFYSNDGGIYHSLKNTNELLSEFPLMIGGKTGYLPQEGGSLITIFRQPKKEIYLISIVISSSDRFEETRKILKWLPQGYINLFNYGI